MGFGSLVACTPWSRDPPGRTRPSGRRPGRESSTGRNGPRPALRYSAGEGRAHRIRADRRLDRLRAQTQSRGLDDRGLEPDPRGGRRARGARRPPTKRNPGDWTIAAWSPTGGGPAIARAEELIDEAADSPARAIHEADLVIIAAPPLAALTLIDDLAGPLAASLPPDALVTDVVTTTGAIA